MTKYLYDKQPNSFKVYQLEQKKSEIIDYRQSKMHMIPQQKRIHTAETQIKDDELPVLEAYRKHFDNIVLKRQQIIYNKSNGEYHKLTKPRIGQNYRLELLNQYYSGQFENKPVAIIQFLKEFRYFLLTQEYYYPYFMDNNHQVLKDIIELPKELYLLQLIEQEKYYLLNNENIEEQLALFNVHPISEIDIDSIIHLDDCGATDHLLDNMISKANNDQYILKYFKR